MASWGLFRRDRVEMYPAADGWRWRFRSRGNGAIMADSGEAYVDARSCQAAARRVCGRGRAFVVLDGVGVV